MKYKQRILPVLLVPLLLLCCGYAIAADDMPEPFLQPDSSTAVPPAAQEPAVPEVPDVPGHAASASPASNTDAPLPMPFQGLLVAAGLVICVGIAMAITRIGPFRRKS